MELTTTIVNTVVVTAVSAIVGWLIGWFGRGAFDAIGRRRDGHQTQKD